MANGKYKTARRREVRRTVPRPEPRWLQSLRRREVVWAAFYIFLFTCIAGALAVYARGNFAYHPAQITTRPIVSRVEFQAVDKQATLDRRLAAKSRVPPVYLPNEPHLDRLRGKLMGLLALADNATIDQVPSDVRENAKLTSEALAELQAFAAGEQPDRSPREWSKLTEEFLRDVFDLAILTPERYRWERSPQTGVGRIVIRHPLPVSADQAERIRSDNVIYSVEDTTTLAERLRAEAHIFPRSLEETVVALVLQAPQPTYLYADEITKQRQQDRYDAEPPALRTHEANEVLVPPGTMLEESHLDVLRAEWETFHSDQGYSRLWLRYAGVTGLTLLIAIGLWIYIYQYNQRIVRNPMRGLAITALLLLCQALAIFITQLHPEFVYATAIFPTLLAALVIAIAYDRRFALAIAAIHALLVMVSLELTVNYAMVLLTGVGVAVSQLGDVRSRSKIVTVGLFSGLAMGAVVLLVGFAQRPLDLPHSWQRLSYDAVYTVITGGLTGLLVQGILPFIEKVFKVTTAMTLKELNDASHPLLQRLAQEAPGTYQHSLRIADMSEAAADSIGADGLLCRVGAMYHDVGKINKPLYFIENQGGGPNRHTKLSPAMSLLIIVGHVKDGIEMAREYRLPSSIRHFIESHHGTTLVEYFFHAARKQKEAADVPAPSEFEFRYPGPKPQTREAAILLLCDSIEAAARSLTEPTPVRLEQIVHKIAMKRLMDGQFDECNLTLQELHRIEQAITKTLCAIYHARIKYPGEGRAAAPVEPQPQPAAS